MQQMLPKDPMINFIALFTKYIVLYLPTTQPIHTIDFVKNE